MTKPSLSLCTHFYNGIEGIKFQVERWKQIKSSYLEEIEIIAVDDCSDYSYEINAGNLPMQMHRVITDITWNQSGCKNLLFEKSTADWLLFFDNDTTATAENIEKIIDKIPTLDIGSYYMPQLEIPWGPQDIKDRITGKPVWNKDQSSVLFPHINVFLIHRSQLEAIGRFDEDFAGNYGYEDTIMHNQLAHQGVKRTWMPDVTFDLYNVYTTEFDRRLGINTSRIVRKALAGWPRPTNHIRFVHKPVDQIIDPNDNSVIFKYIAPSNEH